MRVQKGRNGMRTDGIEGDRESTEAFIGPEWGEQLRGRELREDRELKQD